MSGKFLSYCSKAYVVLSKNFFVFGSASALSLSFDAAKVRQFFVVTKHFDEKNIQIMHIIDRNQCVWTYTFSFIGLCVQFFIAVCAHNKPLAFDENSGKSHV